MQITRNKTFSCLTMGSFELILIVRTSLHWIEKAPASICNGHFSIKFVQNGSNLSKMDQKRIKVQPCLSVKSRPDLRCWFVFDKSQLTTQNWDQYRLLWLFIWTTKNTQNKFELMPIQTTWWKISVFQS